MKRAQAGVPIPETAQPHPILNDADNVDLGFELLGEIHPDGVRYHYLLLDDQDVYGLIGDTGFERLVAAFYRRVPADEVLGPMYPADDLAGAEERLRGFLIFRFGGPQTYLERRGHPRLRLRHAPFAIDQTARDHWMQLMTAALNEVQLPHEAAEVLREFFQSTAALMMNRGVQPSI